RNDRLDPAGARADADKALKLNPETYQALLIRQFLAFDAGRLDDCIADLTVAIRLRPDNPVPWSNRALAYLGKGEYRQAVADATRALELGDKRTSALLTRGAAFAYLGDYPKALADYARAAEMNPNDPRVFIQRSAVHARLGDEAKAAADWDRARELAKKDIRPGDRPVIPDPPKPPERKKLTADEAKELERALAAFDRAWAVGNGPGCHKAADEACKIDPTSAAARSARARILAQERRFKEALDRKS